MLSDLESRLLRRRSSGVRRALQAAGIYLLVALALLAELSLVALHPEDDGVLLIGVILLTIALAIWLPVVLLIPAVVLLWLLPPSVRDAVTGDDAWTWGHAAALAAQLYLACAARFAYRALRGRLVRPGDRVRQATRAAAQPAIAAVNATPAEAPARLSLKPPLPCGRVLRSADAAAYVDRLARLRLELAKTAETLRNGERSPSS